MTEMVFGKQVDGKFIIANEQLCQIINIDEIALCLDGNEAGQCGGRPSAEFVDMGLPCVYKRTSKSSITVTFITGSSAAGESVPPPHFQFPTRAKTCNGVSLNIAAIGDLVFGVRGDRSGNYKAAYAFSFFPESNRAAWAAVGAAAPLTRKFLESDKVPWHTTDGDPEHVLYKKIED